MNTVEILGNVILYLKSSNYTPEYRVNLEENQSRIQYLEGLQEKQFDMMSQLISMIGKENSSAALTASSGRESLMRFRRQLELDEPLFRDPDDYLRPSDLFVGEVAENAACARSQASAGRKKSRSRSRTASKSRDR